MAKKRSTQVREFLAGLAVNKMDNTVSMSTAKRDWCVVMLTEINARDEQRDKPRKRHTVAKR